MTADKPTRNLSHCLVVACRCRLTSSNMNVLLACRRLPCRGLDVTRQLSREGFSRTLPRCSRVSSSAHVSPAAALSASEFREDAFRSFSLSASSVLCLLGAGALWSLSDDHQRRTDCCGIAGVIATPNRDARYVLVSQSGHVIGLLDIFSHSPLSLSDYLLEALTVLKNRGYDSAGLATMTAEGGPLVRYDVAHV
jgi:hypothetical protein